MAGKKDNAVVAVIDNLTNEQAAQMSKEIIKAKKKYAPLGRGTAALGKHGDIGGLLQNSYKKIIGVKDT